MMRLLLIGSGGREHALAWKLSQSSECDRLYVTSGNAGIAEIADCVSIPAKDIPGIVRLAREQRIDLVVVGPESPLIAGLADALLEARILCFGPSAAAARIEGSKAFAKRLMQKSGIPTAPFGVFSDPQAARNYLIEHFLAERYVVKADGEALGKGVFVCETLQDALEAVEFLMEAGGMGAAGKTVVIEERLYGPEVSLMVFSDGQHLLPMPPVRDYKRALDGNRGPNTGGMGSYSPVPDVTPEIKNRIVEAIIQPAIHALAKAKTPYRGVLYGGILLKNGGDPHAIEFNCRFGDPEAQVLMALLESDLVPAAWACAEGSLDRVSVQWRLQAAVCVVLASGGYPGDYRTGMLIEGLEQVARMENVLVFHAGTRKDGGQFTTAGGRVLNVVGLGTDLAEARERAYEAISQIHFEGMHYRTDIAET